MTKAELLRLARRKWPGAKIEANRRWRALDAAGRQVASERRALVLALLEEKGEEAKAMGNTVKRLADAAQFVVDVAGDPPSIPQLAEALAAHRRRETLGEERTELFNEKVRLSHESWAVPCELLKRRPSGIWEIVGRGDTWEEVAERACLIKTPANGPTIAGDFIHDGALEADARAAVAAIVKGDHVKAIGGRCPNCGKRGKACKCRPSERAMAASAARKPQRAPQGRG